MKRYVRLSLAAIAMVAIGAAYAAMHSNENDGIAVTQARISLSQAVTTAEQHANGKASRAEYEHSKQGWVYDVEVVSAGQVFDVRVDADKGSVISSIADKNDHEDEHDSED